jgi:hypothetical protein
VRSLPSVADPRGLRALSRPLRALDEQAAQARAAVAGWDRGPLVAFGVGALCLTALEYLAGPGVLRALLRALHDWLPERIPSYTALRESRWYALLDLSFWVATRALGFVVVPALAIRLLLRQRLREYGLAAQDLPAHLKLYGALFVAVLPLLAVAGLRPEFLAYYPFYRYAADSWFDLLVWEALYAFQFFCVEFFFRGFLLVAPFRSLGSHAVPAAMLPYCMVHFTKPLLEVLGAIPAGLILGVLALHARSIWGGVLLHVAVAWSMDLLAILRTTGLPRVFWPE